MSSTAQETGHKILDSGVMMESTKDDSDGGRVKLADRFEHLAVQDGDQEVKRTSILREMGLVEVDANQGDGSDGAESEADDLEEIQTEGRRMDGGPKDEAETLEIPGKQEEKIGMTGDLGQAMSDISRCIFELEEARENGRLTQDEGKDFQFLKYNYAYAGKNKIDTKKAWKIVLETRDLVAEMIKNVNDRMESRNVRRRRKRDKKKGLDEKEAMEKERLYNKNKSLDVLDGLQAWLEEIKEVAKKGGDLGEDAMKERIEDLRRWIREKIEAEEVRDDGKKLTEMR